MRDLPRCASIRSPPKPALSAASARHPRYGLIRAEGGREPGGLAGGARTVKKSLVHPARYWLDGRYWPGISAVSAPPGMPAASSWTHSGLMSSSIAIRAPWPASAAARSAGTADMLAAYIRAPAASWPIALRATYAPPRRGRGAPGRGRWVRLGSTTRSSRRLHADRGHRGRRVRRGGGTAACRYCAGPGQRACRQERMPDHAAVHTPPCLRLSPRLAHF